MVQVFFCVFWRFKNTSPLVSGAARRQAAWELVYDYWVGMKPDELRLQRTVTSLNSLDLSKNDH